MSSNKKIHEELARIYGNKCMFLAAHCDDLGYKKYQARYTSKELGRLIRNITVHHLRHRFEGGRTTVENCSLVNELAHRYIHTLSRQDEEKINNKIREWKKCKVEISSDLEIPFTISCAEMSVDKKGNMKLRRMKQEEHRKEKTEMQRIKKEYEDR